MYNGHHQDLVLQNMENMGGRSRTLCDKKCHSDIIVEKRLKAHTLVGFFTEFVLIIITALTTSYHYVHFKA